MATFGTLRRLPSPSWAAGFAIALLLAGCAAPPRHTAPEAGQVRSAWSGRLALRVDNPRPQSFHAGFELRGNAQQGELSLFSPIGATVANMSWSPGVARLRADGKDSQYPSLAALTTEVAGAEIPVASLFQWLAGEPAATDGWQAELEQLADGRLVARRVRPPPAVELRLVIDP